LQKELAAQHLRAKALEPEVEGSNLGMLPPLLSAEIRVAGTVDAPPHRHIHFQITRARIADRHFPALQVRLVEHAGRPGVAIFGNSGAEQPLSAWHPNGQEGTRLFMLLVPADDATRLVLDHLGTSDWHFVVALADRLRHHLCTAHRTSRVCWRTIAARLCRQLDDLPQRLRYDNLEVSDGPEGALNVILRKALFGRMPLGDPCLRWHPHRAVLQWLAGAEACPIVPLVSWPVNDEGLLQPAEGLPVGAGMDAPAKRRRLELMPESDRMLLMAAIDTLVAAARKTTGQAQPRGGIDLEAAALALRRDAGATLRYLRGRDLARRLLRRPRRHA